MFELLLFSFGFLLGWNVREHYAKRKVKRFMAAMEAAQEENDDSVLHVKLEKQGDSVLVYNRQTEAFIVQVKSKQEFMEHCENNFQGKVIFMTQKEVEMLDAL